MFASSICALSQPKVDDLFDMSFEDLMNLQVVSSSFTGVDKIKEPASTTIITKQEIAITPARNLYDLMEIYVPGTIWMNHYDSPHIGIRGIINQRNDKILLLVNGKNMNFKARNGATSELENWDLSDIEKIEIIRGPGSVIYGAGAVEAVINIHTKKYTSAEKFEVNYRMYQPYRSNGINASYNHSFNDDHFIFAYASVVNTLGTYPDKGYFIQNNAQIFDLGKDKHPDGFQDLFVDASAVPQVKAYIEVSLPFNSTIWARYTRSGSTYNSISFKQGYWTGYDSLNYPTRTSPTNFRVMRNEQFVVAFDNIIQVNEQTELKSFLAFDSENNSRNHDYLQSHPPQWAPKDSNITKMLMDPSSLRNKYFAASESELLGRSILIHDFSPKFKAAVGLEYSYNFWGSMWFKDDYFRLGDNWNIVSGKNSGAYGEPIYFGTDTNDTYSVGNGWSTHTISIFGEANYEPNDNLTFLLSGRVDKDSYSKMLFSPRVAAIWRADDYTYLKLIAQRSLRMNTAEELLIQHIEGKESDPEALDGVELIFTHLNSTNWMLNASLFANQMDILGWLDPIRSTVLSGTLSLYGIEFETKYHSDIFELTFNHSYVKQIKWKLADSVNQSGISYSDYYTKLAGSEMNGIGNDLNNWSNHTSKIILNFYFLERKLLLHLNSRIYWGFQGAQDGVTLIRNAAVGNLDSANFINVANIIDKYDTYGMDVRLNASASYSFTKNLSFTLYAMNLLDLTHNKRMRYDTGSKYQDANGGGFINKSSMIIEPLTLGLQIHVQF